MSINRCVRWCAIIALGCGFFVDQAAAQFGGGAQPVKESPQHVTDAFVAAAPKSPANSPPERPCLCVGEAEATTAVARIEQVLSQPLKPNGFEFQEQPLEDVVHFLNSEYNIPVQLDMPALEDAGIAADQPVSCNLQNISLKSALRLLLKPHQLTWVIEDEVLTITTPEVAEQRLVTCVYDVRDLVNDGRSFEALADAIMTCVAAETWAVNGGGEAEIRPVQPGLLVISQTRETHDKIGDLLTAIRTYRHGPSESGNQLNTPTETAEPAGGESGAAPEPTPADSREDPLGE